MSDSQLIGQVLMLGYLGNEPTDAFLSWVEEWGIGGVKIFGWNTADLTGLARGIGRMQEEAVGSTLGIPLFVATDQEGGWVRHVKGETSITPGNMAIGASGIAYDAYRSGQIIGSELSILGINMNFAPTVDVYTNPDAHVIGPRSFSSDPVETAFLAVAYYRGLEESGIIATAKHFPGHGNTAADSHGSLPVVLDDLETIWPIDLLPYRLLIKEGLPAVMSGHLNFPLISGDAEPTSLSAALLKDLLRDTLGFGGLVITDDMMMYGVRQSNNSLPKICELALRAGNDMIMVSRPPEVQAAVRDHLLAVLVADPQFKSMVKESVERIVKTKLLYLKPHGKVALYPDLDRVATELPDGSGKGFFFDLACRSTTLLKDEAVPVETAGSERVLLVGDYVEFFTEGTSKYENAGVFSSDPGISRRLAVRVGDRPVEEIARRLSEQPADLVPAAEAYDVIIVCLADEESLELAKKLRPLADKVVVFSVLNPVFLAELPWVHTAVAVYGTGAESFRAGFAALAGDFVPEGRLPFSLPGG